MKLPAPHKVATACLVTGFGINLIGGARGLRTICMVIREWLGLDEPGGHRRAALGVVVAGGAFFWHLLHPMKWTIR